MVEAIGKPYKVTFKRNFALLLGREEVWRKLDIVLLSGVGQVQPGLCKGLISVNGANRSFGHCTMSCNGSNTSKV